MFYIFIDQNQQWIALSNSFVCAAKAWHILFFCAIEFSFVQLLTFTIQLLQILTRASNLD